MITIILLTFALVGMMTWYGISVRTKTDKAAETTSMRMETITMRKATITMRKATITMRKATTTQSLAPITVTTGTLISVSNYHIWLRHCPDRLPS